MDIAKLVGIAVVCAVCCLLLKDQRPEIALLIALAGGAIILTAVVGYIAGILGALNRIVDLTGLDGDVMQAVLKMIGIGYLAEFGAGICEDSGNKSIGDKLVLAAKILIVALSLPIITSLMRLLSQLF